SEEHTSELQSRGHLVCRLLLEKKTESARARRPVLPPRPIACVTSVRSRAPNDPWNVRPPTSALGMPGRPEADDADAGRAAGSAPGSGTAEPDSPGTT